MKNNNHALLKMGINLFTSALVAYEIYVGFTYGYTLFQNNHLSILIAVLFAAIPVFTIMAMSFTTMGFHTGKTHVVLISFCALVAGLAVQWFFQYGFMNKNLESKQAVAVQNSSQMQAHQSKLASIETTLKANEKYAAVDLSGADANIALKKKQIEKVQALKCPDWDCKESKPKQISALEIELAELEGQRNGAKAYKEALDARTAAYQTATTIHATIATDDAFIANVAVLMGYPREHAYHAFSVLYASFMISFFLVLTFFSSVRSELESLIEEKRARTRKSMPIQETEDDPVIEQPKSLLPSFFKSTFNQVESGSNYQAIESNDDEARVELLKKPLTFDLGGYIIDLEETCHGGCCGQPRKGKTSTFRQIVYQLMLKNSPDKLQFVVFDQKELGFKKMERAPQYLKRPVAVTLDQAFELINWLEKEMQNRKKFLSQNNVEDIQSLKNHNMPFLIFIIDEGYGLDQSMKTLEVIIKQGRAMGIHILFGTQYATKGASSSQFMAQLGFKMSHYLSNETESRTILGALPDGHRANNLKNSGDAVIVDCYGYRKVHVDFFSPEDFVTFLDQKAIEYGEQPIAQPEPAPKKMAFMSEGFKTSYTPTKVAFAPLQRLQPLQPATVAKSEMSEFGGNVVQFPHKIATDATCNFTGAFYGNLALKPEENQQGRNATDLQPIEVAKPTLQPDKTQQNQQGRNATTLATDQVANLQLATYKVQPPLATSDVRSLVDWALNEMDATPTDQAIADFIFRANGRKLHKGSVNKYRVELQAKKEKSND